MYTLSLSVYVLFLAFIVEGNKTLSQQNDNFWDDTEPFGLASAPSPDLRLPSNVAPSFYRLKLTADLENSTFTGEVYITIKANKKTKEIVLHAKNLNITNNAKVTEQIYERVGMLFQTNYRRKRETNATAETNTTTNVPTEPAPSIAPTNVTVVETATTNSTVSNANVTVSENVTEANSNTTTTTKPPSTQNSVTHSTVRNIKILSITSSTGDRLILTLATSLKPNVDYILELSFSGQISNALTGFYKSTYTNNAKEIKSLGVTQFEPTSARAAFPCFDEPGFKAMFEISIAHDKNLNVLSNMKIATQEDISDKPGWQWTHFDRSVKMSTYLVAYALTDFKAQETSYVSKDNVTKPIKIWTRPELISKAKYALTITPKLLEYYEDVFGVPYALDKMDLIAIPDFSSGAMENWGLITFRETTLLFDEQNSVPRDKQNVAIDIAHELAHQWFGNLVTMKWWTDLWLNEGFATYIEYVGVDHIAPEWKMFDSFTRDKMDLLRSDALKNTSPVSRKVIDAAEISQKFDEISYTKGANLIRMLNHTISEQLFHTGLVNYLNQWKFANAEENDLWQAMSLSAKDDTSLAGRSLVDFMNSWTRQPGYPVLNVHRDYATGAATFQQQLFSSSNQPYKNMEDQIWQIPISYTTMDTPEEQWTAKPKLWLTEKSTTAKLPINASQALYVNIAAIGYYRVNYDPKNWELLSQALKSGHVKSPIARAQLIDDAFNLAKAAQLNYSDALGLTTYIIGGEDSKMVWDLLLNNMAFLRHNLRATSGYVHFQDYMKILLQKQLEKVNYGLDKPKDDNEAFLIENLVMWECYVEAPRCLNWAKAQFESWMNQTDFNNNPIPSYLRSVVYGIALRHGGRREFEFLWQVFQKAADPNVKSLAIASLPSTRDEGLITMLLEKSLSEIPKQYAVAVWSVEPPTGTALAQRFLLDNFDRVYNKFTALDTFMFPTVLSGAFGLITDERELDTLKSFAVQHKSKLLAQSQTLQKIVDTARLRIDWVRRHAASTNTWFQEYLQRNTTIAPPTVAPTTLHTNAASNATQPAPEPTTVTTAPNVTEPSKANATSL